MVALFARAWIEIFNKCANLQTICVALFARAWIEIINGTVIIGRTWVALFARAWIEILFSPCLRAVLLLSPSLRGRGLKYRLCLLCIRQPLVALFARAWIEIAIADGSTSAVIVALFARAWIEIFFVLPLYRFAKSRPLCEGVD